VNDNETYASRVAQVGEGAIDVHDFGVAGWGPHQMLAGLQSGRFARSLTRPPTHAVYFFIDDQIKRAAGYSSWDEHGPRYRLAGDGRVVRDGNFDTDGPPKKGPPPDDGFLGWRTILGNRPVDPPGQVELTVAILLESARLLERMAPGMRLHVLYWTYEDDSHLDVVATALKAGGVILHTVDEVIPGYRKRWREYLLSPVDWHPTAAAHRLIGDYIARQIVQCP
jgi:hypothetical protein